MRSDADVKSTYHKSHNNNKDYYMFILIVPVSVLVSEKENLVASSVSGKKEESHKREINRDGEKDDRNKKLRKAESKDNIPISVEKKQVLNLTRLIIVFVTGNDNIAISFSGTETT